MFESNLSRFQFIVCIFVFLSFWHLYYVTFIVSFMSQWFSSKTATLIHDDLYFSINHSYVQLICNCCFLLTFSLYNLQRHLWKWGVKQKKQTNKQKTLRKSRKGVCVFAAWKYEIWLRENITKCIYWEEGQRSVTQSMKYLMYLFKGRK